MKALVDSTCTASIPKVCKQQYDLNPPFSCVTFLAPSPLSVLSLAFSNTMALSALLAAMVAAVLTRAHKGYKPTADEIALTNPELDGEGREEEKEEEEEEVEEGGVVTAADEETDLEEGDAALSRKAKDVYAPVDVSVRRKTRARTKPANSSSAKGSPSVGNRVAPVTIDAPTAASTDEQRLPQNMSRSDGNSNGDENGAVSTQSQALISAELSALRESYVSAVGRLESIVEGVARSAGEADRRLVEALATAARLEEIVAPLLQSRDTERALFSRQLDELRRDSTGAAAELGAQMASAQSHLAALGSSLEALRSSIPTAPMPVTAPAPASAPAPAPAHAPVPVPAPVLVPKESRLIQEQLEALSARLDGLQNNAIAGLEKQLADTQRQLQSQAEAQGEVEKLLTLVRVMNDDDFDD